MFKFNNKRDVDRHVSQISQKLTEQERSGRGLAIAKSYAKVNEYELARDWVQRYLEIKPEDAAAHKFLGDMYERLQKPEQAITSFQRSYNLNSKQSDIIKNVCRLFLLDDGWSSSPAKAKYWCDLAETENIRDDNVFSLRLKMVKTESKKGEKGGGSKHVEDMILKEITARPHDVSLRIRLVKFLLDEKRINDAFKYCFDLEMKCIEIFLLSIDWYTTVASVLNQTVHDSWNYWCLLLTTMEKQIFLTLKKDLSLQAIKQNNIKEVSNLLFEFDQVLKKASECLHDLTPVKELADEFINHFRAQLSLHIAALLFQKQKITNNDQWRETTKKCLPFLLFAFQSATVNTNSEATWLKNTNESIRNLFTHLKKEGAFRCTQSARTILACKSTAGGQVSPHKCWFSIDDIFNQVRETCADLNWRKSMYRLLFANADQQSKISSSYFVQNSFFQEPRYEIISFNDIDTYEDLAQYLYPSSLDHHVYLGLGRKDLHTYKTKTFSGLNLSIANLINCNPETINRLDMDCFLYCAIIQAKRRLEAEKTSYETFNNKPDEKPIILPAANIIEGLCSEEQNEWWLSAFKIYKNISGENLAQLKATLQFGIEAVRGIDTPKVDSIILLKLGDILLARSINCDKVEEQRHLEIRVEYIYKFAMKMLRNRESDNMRRLFKFTANNYDVEREVDQLAGTAIGHLSGIYFKREEYKEFIEDFSGLQNPWAHFFKAEAYKKLDETGKTPRKQRKLYAEKAKENLIETLALLDANENIDKNNPLRIRVEKDLKRLQYDLSTSFTEELDFHNTSQNGYGNVEEEIFHNASASSFRGRREIGPNYSEKFTEVETLIRKLSDLVISVRDDVLCVRNDITSLRDEMLNIRGDITDLSVNKDTKALNDIYKSIEDLSWNVTCMMNLGAAGSAIPPNLRFPPPPPVHLQHMYNTAYPIYPMQFAGQAQRGPPLPPHLQYGDQLGMNMMANYASPILPSPTAQPQQQQPAPLQMQPITPSPQIPQQIQQQIQPQIQPQFPVTNGQKSSLLEALNTPSVLNTWTNTFNPSTQPPPPQQPNIVIASPQVQQPIIQNKPVEKAPPVNVVITSSDPLPAQNSFVSQPTLSVTIPPQHIKNYDQNKMQKEPLKPKDDNSKVKETFGGFTGSLMTPTATPDKTVTKVKEVENKQPAQPSPFANFTFGQNANKSFSELFGGLNTSVSKTEVAPATSTTPTTAARQSTAHDEDDVEHYEPTAQFEPVIPLPDLVETKTGEEDEDVLFTHRAKLLRYDAETKEWKERGIGEMKVLTQKSDPTKGRLLMRREQIFKLCCNMPITKELKFTKMKETALSFGGQDFSETDGMRTEKLTVRFKTAELTQSFMDAVKVVQKRMSEVKTIEKPKEPEKKKEEAKGFGDKFKPKAGSWNCDACYISNKPETLYCVACESPKDNTVPKKEAKSLLKPADDAPKFSFGMPNASGFSFGMPQAAPAPAPVVPAPVSSTTSTASPAVAAAFGAPSTGFSFGSTPSTGFSFGSPAAASTSTTTATNLTTTFAFRKPEEAAADTTTTSTFKFSLGQAETKSTPEPAAVPNELGKPDAGFNFVFKKKSPVKVKSPGKSRNDSVNSEGGEEVDENEYHEEEENQTYFTPVIPLPDKIEVKTGEEDEELLYSHRAKLFRFVDKEWKERGIGDIKILKHKETGQLRVVMRRDQILKICLNFFLTSDIEFKRKDDQSWTFGANDFSEGEFEARSFAIRFKNKEICDGFRKALSDALDGKSTTATNGPESNDSSDEILKRLMLPDNFFNYMTVVPCPGCIGCNDENYVYDSNRKSDMVFIEENPISLHMPNEIIKIKPRRASQDKRVSFKIAEKKENEALSELLNISTPVTSSPDTKNIFGAALTKSEATPNIFAKFNSENPSPATANIFGSVFGNNSTSVFSSSANTTPASVTNASTNATFGSASIFGNNSNFSFGSASSGGSVFGGANKENQASPFANAFSNTPAFGNNIFSNSNSNSEANKNIFSTAASTFSFADAAKELDKPEEKSDSIAPAPVVPDFLTKTSSIGGFAEIAAGAAPSQPFGGGTASGGFYGLTVKDDFFSKNLNKQNTSGTEGDANDSETVNDDNYDPHYEPIISLPDEIQVSTGEEDEEKLFGERAKLYRYDVKLREWKERGVGELKILHHEAKSRYRLILRREQIFKLVLNQLITSDIHMAPMENSTKAFCWGGMNYAEGGAGEAEQLAIRFKNEDLALKFKNMIEECQAKVAVLENNLNPEND